ncbi:hypothetical protein PIB30_013525 [Stylosanthes scabra]|uniref:Uncharacterized protein n=1 Tax=Stylosanthes scabra TaxID=79078 RepID=A0ABU6R5E8_9FABA|nr:hypothetical protein [Stylosanthes scabra]
MLYSKRSESPTGIGFPSLETTKCQNKAPIYSHFQNSERLHHQKPLQHYTTLLTMDDPPTTMYYYVYRGWRPGIYTFRDDFEANTRYYKKASYAFHHTLESATVAWNTYFGHRPPQIPSATNHDNDVPDPFLPPEIRHQQRGSPSWRCMSATHRKWHAHCQHQQPEGQSIAALNLRALLMQACHHLGMPPPIYRTVAQRIPDRRLTYRHLVSLVPPARTAAIVVCSRLALDPNHSWDDAARLGLRRLCELTGGFVDDYSLDQLHLWKKRYTDLGSDLEAMEARMDAMVLRQASLRRQLGMSEEEEGEGVNEATISQPD